MPSRALAVLAALLAALPLAAAPIPIEILEPADRPAPVRQFPVAVGLVFPDGELAAVPGGAVVDSHGAAVPFDAQATGWWDAGKTRVKWLLLNFRADGGGRYAFARGAAPAAPQGPALVTRDDGAVTVDTGPLRIVLKQGSGRLFDAVWLNGKPMLAGDASRFFLTLTFDAEPAQVREWRVEVVESTPDRAILRGQGYFGLSWQERAAKLDARYEFFRNESFVRVYHTLTWMVANPKIGARELGVELSPLANDGAARLGLAHDSAESLSLPLAAGADVYVHQDDADHFAVTAGGKTVKEGARMAGWMAAEAPDGRGVGVALRDAWQTFPTAFAAKEGCLRVEFWPSQGPAMGFMPEDLIPPDFYNDAAYWNRFQWVEKKGHFVHENIANPHYLHTAEGAARTHELAVLFYDKTSARSMAEINSLTQHPFIARQDPASAMRVPFMGFDITPVRPDYPDMERAIEDLGRIAVSRWAKNHDYGFWRYGMMRWGNTGPCYRWFDGVQYNSVIIPWMLFARGGGRHWLEEAQATARFAMDAATNHFNTRGYPTGCQAQAGGLPFPWGPHFMSKAPKIAFLSYCYHMTGYARAKEVMDEVIAGNKEYAAREAKSRSPEHRGGHGRELYNMLSFWAGAYEETFDPDIEALAREWRQLLVQREYNPKLNVFRQPNVYLEEGIVNQLRLWPDEAVQAAYLRFLKAAGYPDLPDGGVYSSGAAAACGWASRATGDARYAKIAWDIARGLADLVPSCRPLPAHVPVLPIEGNNILRHYLLPILVGYSQAVRLGMKQTDPFVLRDAFISLPTEAGDKARGQVFLRPRRDGDLRVALVFDGLWRRPLSDMKVAAFDPEGREAVSALVPHKGLPEVPDRFYPHDYFLRHRGEIVLPGARQGQVWRLVVEGSAKNSPKLLVAADADIMQQAPASGVVFFYDLAGQEFTGSRIFAKATADTVTITNPYLRPFTVRDAQTGEVLCSSALGDKPGQAGVFKTTPGRLLQFSLAGHMEGRSFQGVSPLFSRTRDEWFDPEEP